MIELLTDYLQEWHTKDEILKEYGEIIGLHRFGKKDENQFRAFRKEKEEYNKKYFNHEVNQCLVHSNTKGYKLTNDPKEIIEMETDFIKRAKDMFYKAYHIKQARIENNNYSFDDFMEEQKSPLIEATD